MKPYIIADIGSNHRNNLDLAKIHIELAKEVGVNAVKFQYYTHKELYGFEGKAEYELPEEWLEPLAECCKDNEVDFMCSAFSVAGYKRIDPLVKIHKVASCEANHVEILNYLKTTNKTVLVSGGASFVDYDPLTIPMACVAKYPADIYSYNLSQYTEYKWGLSDHSKSYSLAILALGLGARYFEVHFDDYHLFYSLDNGKKNNIGPSLTPDTPVSLSKYELITYCDGINNAYECLSNNDHYIPKDIQSTHKRRLIVTKDIKKGDKLIMDVNYGIYRSKYPQRYNPPASWLTYHNKPATKDYEAGQSI
jgi:sialic acid synthase SpsE